MIRITASKVTNTLAPSTLAGFLCMFVSISSSFSNGKLSAELPSLFAHLRQHLIFLFFFHLICERARDSGSCACVRSISIILHEKLHFHSISNSYELCKLQFHNFDLGQLEIIHDWSANRTQQLKSISGQVAHSPNIDVKKKIVLEKSTRNMQLTGNWYRMRHARRCKLLKWLNK